jgi:AraC-like DNA-binding protein
MTVDGGPRHLRLVPSPARVWACDCGPVESARLRDALDRDDLRLVPSSNDIIECLRGADLPEVLVIGVAALGPRIASAVVREILTSFPHMAIVAYCSSTRDAPPRIGALVAAGVHQLLLFGINDQRVLLRAVIRDARHQRAAETVMAALRSCVPRELHPMVEVTLARPHDVTNVRRLAATLGLHRKTLFNRCSDAAFLSPAALVVWTRLALVAYLLETTRSTVETIAMDLAFPSPTALRNSVKRYTGLRATEIRHNGGLAHVVGRLSARLSARSTQVHPV